MEEIQSLELEEVDKVVRKRNLLRLKEILGSKPAHATETWAALWAPLLRRLQADGEGERCREVAAGCVLACYAWVAKGEFRLQYLFPILRSRLGDPEERSYERSEEVRALLARILRVVLEKFVVEELR